MTAPVAITGIGVISAAGAGKEALFRTLSEGGSTFSPRMFREKHFPLIPPVFGAYVDDSTVRDFPGRQRATDNLSREVRLFCSAAVMACRDAGLDPKRWQNSRVGVFAATMFAGADLFLRLTRDRLICGTGCITASEAFQGCIFAPASQVSIWLGTQAANITMASGWASGIDVLAYAADFIREERATIGLAGGFDVLSYLAACALDEDKGKGSRPYAPRPFDLDRRGPVFGEAGVVLVLEDSAQACARGASISAELCGAGSAFEPDGSFCGLERVSKRAIEQCMESACIRPAEVDLIFASANGHRLWDASEAAALHTIFGDHVPVCAVKGAIGECLGASSALQVAAAVLSLHKKVVFPTVGFNTPDPLLPRLRINRDLQSTNARHVLVNCLDGRGYAAALLVRRAPAGEELS